MAKKLLEWVGSQSLSRLPLRRRQKLLRYVARNLGVSLWELNRYDRGLYTCNNGVVTAEEYFYQKVLPHLLARKKSEPELVLFDVGANIGSVSVALAESYPSALVYSFEPNPQSFKELKKVAEGHKNIGCFNIALGSKRANADMFVPADNDTSGHATLVPGVNEELHHRASKELSQTSVRVHTLDAFCRANKIDKIDFIKIDVEGYEYAVLEGAKRVLKRNIIDAVLFEFNAMNVLTRVFLHDFYKLLSGHAFYRLHPDGLIALVDYHPRYEIFEYQNILAVRPGVIPENLINR